MKHPIRKLYRSRLKIYNRISNGLERLGHEKLLDLRAEITAELKKRYRAKLDRKEGWESRPRVIIPRIEVQLERRAREREIRDQTF